MATILLFIALISNGGNLQYIHGLTLAAHTVQQPTGTGR
jgi:hypothetical protein